MYYLSITETRELSPREVDAIEYYGSDIAVAFPAEGPSGQRYVPTSESQIYDPSGYNG